jgi:site-specific recombinase XerD
MSRRKRDSRGRLCFWQSAKNFLHDELPSVRRSSDKTIEAYRLALECYLLFLDDQYGIVRDGVTFECFESDRIRAFIKWMNEIKGYSPRTANLRLSVIRSFLKYASYEDISLLALFQASTGIRGPKQTRQPICFLSKKATAALLLASGTRTVKERRNRMLLIFMYDTGVRVSEAVQVKLGDIQFGDTAFATIKGKGSKIRSVPLMHKTVEHLKAYLSEFHPDKQPAAPLFYSHKQGRPQSLSVDTISLVLKSVAVRARESCGEVPEKIHCHLLRKTRAMDLYQEGIPLPIIMQFLGHESAATTSAFYAFATMDMIKDAVERSSSISSSEPPLWKGPEAMDLLYSLR